MKAVVLTSFGAAGEVLQTQDVDRPAPGPREVLVRLAAAGVNPVDVKTAAGLAGERFGRPPFVLGWDIAGVVAEAGSEVTSLAAGDEVLGLIRFPDPAGAYAEFAAAPADELVRKPAALDFATAAALPLAGLTALQALDLAEVKAGERVLVHAAAGGVGHLALQLAKLRGAYVIATARADKHAFLRELGADEAVDYSQGPFEEAVGEVDVVFDAYGYRERSLAVLGAGGRLIVIVGGVSDQLAAAAEAAGVSIVHHLVRPGAGRLEALVGLVAQGRLRVEIDRVLPLEEVVQAHEYSSSGRARGKVVLSVA
jgi:NADPH:quinone reductase-like Zn-dependent oxidoreductase